MNLRTSDRVDDCRSPNDTCEELVSDLGRMDALADAGRAFHEGKLTGEQFKEKLFDLGVSGRDADLEVFYNHPSNKEWSE